MYMQQYDVVVEGTITSLLITLCGKCHFAAMKSFQLSGASLLAMEKLKYTLQIWNRLSTHVRVRDRSIKVLQYGCQMLIGFYGKQLTKVLSEYANPLQLFLRLTFKFVH